MEDVIVALWITCGIAAVRSLLTVVVFRKAGFGWRMSMIAMVPIVGLFLQSSLVFFGYVNLSEGLSLGLPFALLPLLILAFTVWPMAARQNTSPETSK